MLRMLNLGLCLDFYYKLSIKRNSINLSMDSGHRVQPFVTDTFVTVAPLVCRGRLGTGAAARVINKNPDRQTTLNTSNIIS
jgi:hypothetical protein